jgi:hypothetical protein
MLSLPKHRGLALPHILRQAQDDIALKKLWKTKNSATR